MKVALIMMDPMLSKRKHRAGGAVYALAAYLKHKNFLGQGIALDIFNFNSAYMGAININASAIIDFKPDVVGFSTYCWNLDAVKLLVKLIKSSLPESLIVLGGPEVSYNASEMLRDINEVDMVIRGEGEITFSEVINSFFLGNKDYSNVLGITYRVSNKKIVTNKDRPLHAILDDFPSPFQTQVINLSDSDGEVVYETVRGCMFKCSYCLHTKGMSYVREYSLQRVEDDLKIILKSPHVDIIWFLDPTFNANEKRALDILKIIEKYNPHMRLAFELRADMLTDKIIDQMSKLNVSEVGIGLQSYSEKTNEMIYRKNNIAIVEEKLYKLHRAISRTCVQFDIDLIYGLPGDTYESYKNSVNYVISLGARIYYQPLRIFKGTKLYEDKNKYGIYYNQHSPYNVLSNRTFTIDDMVSAYCLNVGIDYYNRGGKYKNIVDAIISYRNITHVDFLENIGRYFWNKKCYDVFRMANWTPDDRNDTMVNNDFVTMLYAYLKNTNDDRLIELMKENNFYMIDYTQKDTAAAFFHLAI